MKQHHEHGLSHEESRYLDGELPPEDMRRFERELAADPDRAARLDAYRDAMGLWKQDVERRTAMVDEDALADRVMASISSGEALELLRPLAPRWMTAAAVLLIGVGVIGTTVVRSQRAGAAQASQKLEKLSFMSEAMVEMMAADPAFQPSTMLNGGR